MSVQLSEQIVNLIQDEKTIKVVASVGKSGVVDAAIKQSLRINENGDVEFLEILESSDTNRNMIHSLWFEHNISILLFGKNRESYELRGIPVRSIIEGAYFEKEYRRVQKKFRGECDLAAIWVVKVTEIRDKNLKARVQKEQEDYPIIAHLDRLAKVSREGAENES